MFFRAVISIAFFCFALPLAFAEQHFAEQIRFPVVKYKLKNGMTVLLHEDHRAPMVSFHQWFRVGSRNEKPGLTGMAHFFEHLMFKGTKKYSSSDFEGLIQANGGVNNAFTTYDYTGYYIDLPSGKLDLVLDMESDRMVNLVFDAGKVKSEREVVKEERRYRYDNNVSGYINEAVYSSVFKVHNYRWPVIGYMRDLNSTTMDELKGFYKTYYSPNNAILVIAGDIDIDRVKTLVEKYYAHIPAQEIPENKVPPEPKQQGERNIILRKNVQNPTLAIAYKSVKAGDDDQYAFDLLSNILGEGQSSRLYKRLVYREQSVSSISSFAYTPKDPGVFEVFASVKPGQSVDKVLRSIYSEIYKLRTKLVTERELEKAKNQVMKSYIDSLKTISGKARAIATNEILFGNYEELFNDIDRYNSVTREKIQEVTGKYLMPYQRSVVRVLPKSKKIVVE